MSRYLTQREQLRLPVVVDRLANGEMVLRHATMGRVEIDDACTGCRLCVRVCPVKALEMGGPKHVRMIGENTTCIACGDCVAICKPGAVRLSSPMTYAGLYKHIGRGSLEFPRRF
jgi:ferredoxin